MKRYVYQSIGLLFLVLFPMVGEAQGLTRTLDPSSSVVTPLELRKNPFPPPTPGFIPPVLYPEGPGCAPSEEGCDILVNTAGIRRVEAEANNTLEAYFWGGMTLLSPFWTHATTVPHYVNPRIENEGGVIDLGKIDQPLQGTDWEIFVENAMKNLTMWNIFNDTGGLNVLNLDGDQLPQRVAPGVFPLGYQYELTPQVFGRMKQELEGVSGTGWEALLERLRFVPSHKYVVMPSKEYGYVNDLTRPLWSDALERQVRMKIDFMLRPQWVLNRGGGACETNALPCIMLKYGYGEYYTIGVYTTDGGMSFGRPGDIGISSNVRMSQWASPRQYGENKGPVSPVNDCFQRGGRLASMQDLVVLSRLDGTKSTIGGNTPINLWGNGTHRPAVAYASRDLTFRDYWNEIRVGALAKDNRYERGGLYTPTFLLNKEYFGNYGMWSTTFDSVSIDQLDNSPHTLQAICIYE